MKRLIVAALTLILAAGTASAETLRGSWTGSSEEAGKIHLNVARKHSQNGQTFATSAFSGLSEAQIRSASSIPVQFAMNREAGNFSFEGTFKDGYGGGAFTFTPSASYLSTIRSMGISTDGVVGKRSSVDETLMQLAIHDVSTAYIRSMQALGYRVPLDKYLAMRIFRVTPELVGELRSLGYDEVSAEDLISSQIHRVTPQYIREMRASGMTNLSLDKLVSTRIHRASPEFIAEMKALGYDGLSHEQLVSMRIHRVTPEFIRELRELGYTGIPASKLVSMRIHRVTPEFIRELGEAGYSKVPVDKMISMRIHGVDATFMKKMNDAQ
ncbi:MAG TPA: hypothetical protein VMS98_03615 [Thermoanaerobaculia bacterium]|nr:hypothetical protein [Thermoanaerobaculia bacterium]